MSNDDINPVQAYFDVLNQAREQQAHIDFTHRKRHLRQLSELISHNKPALLNAMQQDYGYRSPNQSLISDILSSLDSLHYWRQHFAAQLKPRKRDAGFPARLFGAKARQHFQALGLVAIRGNWQQPLASAIIPATQAIAAGNRVLLLLDARCPATAECLSQLVLQSPLRDILAISSGRDANLQSLKQQPWDLVFDRSTETRPSHFEAR